MKQSDGARRQIEALRRHYRNQGRTEASRRLTSAIRQAARQIAAGDSVSAPRPYPELARDGEAWTRAGRYWVAHTIGSDPVIIAVMYDESDLPGRFVAEL